MSERLIQNQLDRWKAIRPGMRLKATCDVVQKLCTVTAASQSGTSLAWIENRSEFGKVFSGYGYAVCVTCGKPMLENTKFCQGGHYIASAGVRRLHAVMAENINVQCSVCNEHRSARMEVYSAYMSLRYGSHVMDLIKHEKDQGDPLTDYELAEIKQEANIEIRRLQKLIMENM